MIDNRSVGCNWLSIMKLQPIPNPNTQCEEQWSVSILSQLLQLLHDMVVSAKMEVDQ